MELDVTIAGRTWRVALDRPRSLAIPLRFNGLQPNFFDAPEASAQPLAVHGFVGDTRQGGACNVSELRLVPHCNGTHTESAGHILHETCPIHDALPQSLMPAVVISVTPAAEAGDSVITRAAVAAATDGYEADAMTALIVRTLPNDAAKMSAIYGDANEPPFFAAEAMTCLVERGVRHLLVDFPSIDRMNDRGRLANHRIFWNVAPGRREAGPDSHLDRTVTEMIFVPDDIADGLYLLNLQAPAFASDAAPSRPVIYPLTGAG
jgi:kynurenine formamidase